MTYPVTDQQLHEKLKSQPVLITGADGFVGSHLTEKLLELGAHVHVLVRPTSSGMLHNIGHIRTKIVTHRGDLTDKQAISVALKALKTDGGKPYIFHLGAQAHVGESWDRPYETLATNVLGTINLLQSVVDVGLQVERIDVAGSSEEYGNIREDVRQLYKFDEKGGLILDETSPLNPQSVYATSKVAADFLTRNYFKSYGLPTIVTRMFNNYGPRQNPRFITGTIITQALCRDVVNLGFVDSKRDFCFVKDGARGHIHVTLYGNPGETYVYGYGQNVTILEWYNMIIEIGREEGLWKEKELKINQENRSRLGNSEVMELRVGYDKINKLTGWKPEFSWRDGLRETIRWFCDNRPVWIGRVDW
ncbi:MAG: GDP-mannose 4,6-dehydratase [Candidatus Omnitrophica bacterium]|nr:GDP-mannose 4,6-dehydratase [Candidatus Omnitrophota bacterium]